MIKYTSASEISHTIFETPFDHELDKNNRWVRLEQLIPWDSMAEILMERLSDYGRGTVDLRYVLGALLIKGIEDLSDEDTLQQISENIYMQYFVGLRSLYIGQLFTPEVLVSVRKRLGETGMQKLNDVILKHAYTEGFMMQRKGYGRASESENKGVLKIDATVAPQDITYPTDTKLLNKVREFTESIIDYLWESGYIDAEKKPRTYRRKAAEYYLNFAKKKKPKSKQIKKCIRQQLQYIRRNKKHIHRVFDAVEQRTGSLPQLTHTDYRSWLVSQHIYTQQKKMYKDGRRQVSDRIVSLSQPWVRPIVRGKAGKRVEFGSKLNVSEVDGFIKMDRIDFNAYNEALDLEEILDGYKELYGQYPQSVLVDKIYLNRKNRKVLNDRKIHHYGPVLGRPKQMSKQEKQRRKKKQNKRSEIEGKFGLGKLKYGLNKIRMKRPDTTKAHLGLIAISMNMMQLLHHIAIIFEMNLKQLLTETAQKFNFQKYVRNEMNIPSLNA